MARYTDNYGQIPLRIEQIAPCRVPGGREWQLGATDIKVPFADQPIGTNWEVHGPSLQYSATFGKLSSS
jgi:hypothetical protein